MPPPLKRVYTRGEEESNFYARKLEGENSSTRMNRAIGEERPVSKKSLKRRGNWLSKVVLDDKKGKIWGFHPSACQKVKKRKIFQRPDQIAKIKVTNPRRTRWRQGGIIWQ